MEEKAEGESGAAGADAGAVMREIGNVKMCERSNDTFTGKGFYDMSSSKRFMAILASQVRS